MLASTDLDVSCCRQREEIAAEIAFKCLQINLCSDIIKEEQSLVIIKSLLPFYFSFITQRWLYLIMFSLLALHKIYDFVSICINVCCLFTSTVKHQQISSFSFLLNQDLWFYCDKAKKRRLWVDPHVQSRDQLLYTQSFCCKNQQISFRTSLLTIGWKKMLGRGTS